MSQISNRKKVKKKKLNHNNKILFLYNRTLLKIYNRAYLMKNKRRNKDYLSFDLESSKEYITLLFLQFGEN